MLSSFRNLLSNIISLQCNVKERVYLNTHNTKACSVTYDNDFDGETDLALLLSYNKKGMVNGWDHSSIEYIHHKAYQLQEPLVIEVVDLHGEYTDLDIRVEENTNEIRLVFFSKFTLKLFTTKDIVIRILGGRCPTWAMSYPFNNSIATVVLDALAEYCEAYEYSSIVDTGCTVSE